MDPIKLFALIYNQTFSNKYEFIDYFNDRFSLEKISQISRNGNVLKSLTNFKEHSSGAQSVLTPEDAEVCEFVMELVCAMQVMENIDRNNQLRKDLLLYDRFWDSINEFVAYNFYDIPKGERVNVKDVYPSQRYETLVGLLDITMSEKNSYPHQLNWYFLRLGQGNEKATFLDAQELVSTDNAAERTRLQRMQLQIAPKKGFIIAPGSESCQSLLKNYLDSRGSCNRDYYAPKMLFRLFGGKPDKAFSREEKLGAAHRLKLYVYGNSEECARITFSEAHIKALQQGSLGQIVRNHMPEVYACLDLLPREQADMSADEEGSPDAVAAEAAPSYRNQ